MAIRLSANDRLQFISNMSTMLSAGIPLLDVIESLLEDAKGNSRTIFLALHKDVAEGHKISESLAKYKDAFDPVVVSLIRASEEAGTLDATLKDLTRTIKKEIEFSDKVRGALTYPAMVMVVFFAIMLVILVVVIPRIADVFGRLKVELPVTTKAMIQLSNFLIHETLLFILILAAIVGSFVLLLKTQRKLLLNLFFRLPGLTSLARDIDITRLTRSLSLLLSSGIPIVNALNLSQAAVIQKDMVALVEEARSTVSAGKPLSSALKKAQKNKIVPGIIVRIVNAGEKTGTLAQSMQDIADYFDLQVSRRIKTLTTMLEPLMLVVIAVFVGGMMVSIIAPIYSMIGSITNK